LICKKGILNFNWDIDCGHADVGKKIEKYLEKQKEKVD
jgi:hypothetical protein